MSLDRAHRRRRSVRWRFWARELAWAFVTVAGLLAFAWLLGWVLGRPWVGVTVPMERALPRQALAPHTP